MEAPTVSRRGVNDNANRLILEEAKVKIRLGAERDNTEQRLAVTPRDNRLLRKRSAMSQRRGHSSLRLTCLSAI